jgi:L-cysteine S-thiosulfotransferase
MKKKLTFISTSVLLTALVAGCAVDPKLALDDQAKALMKAGFKDRGQALATRIDQDKMQAVCSDLASQLKEPSADQAKAIEAEQMALIKWPADGKLMGDWKTAERIAQDGRGKQWSDAADAPSGGNCYACHQLTKAEVSYGNIGPSLLGYGKVRGTSEAMQKYTYGKLYNTQAYKACSNMPRFGHAGILNEKQIKDLVAFLLDPASPVNQ